METVLNLLLIRFALIAGGVTLLVIVGATVVLLLRRKGMIKQETIDRAREQIVPMAKDVLAGRRRGRGILGSLLDRDRRGDR